MAVYPVAVGTRRIGWGSCVGFCSWNRGVRCNADAKWKHSQTLLFFDQRERSQVAFAKRFLAEAKARVKPILVGGEPLKLMRQWKREVFYDQGGVLSRKFLLQQVPALITQDGNRLRVDEIRP